MHNTNMIQTVPLNNTEHQKPTGMFKRRRTLFMLACAAGGLLIITLALLGYSQADHSTISTAAVSHAPPQTTVKTEESVKESSLSLSPALLITSPLQTVPLLFKRHTVKAVVGTIILALVLILVVVLPIVLSQTGEAPEEVIVEPEHKPFPNPVADPKAEPSFFSDPLNLGLVIAGIIVFAIGFGLAAGMIYRRKFNGGGSPSVEQPGDFASEEAKNYLENLLGPGKTLAIPDGPNKEVIEDIWKALLSFYSTIKHKEKLTSEERKCFAKARVYWDEQLQGHFIDHCSVIGSHYKLGDYNMVFFLSPIEYENDDVRQLRPFIITAARGDRTHPADSRYLNARATLKENEPVEAISLNPERLNNWSPPDLQKLLEYVKSLKPKGNDDI